MKRKTPVLVRLTPRRFRDRIHRISAVLGGIGAIFLMWFLIHGIALCPVHYLTTKPDAPISKFYAWGIHHLGTRGWMAFHFLACIFIVMLYFEHLDVMKWKKEQEAEQMHAEATSETAPSAASEASDA